ncbi:hypothetical protein V2S66_33390 [Streptomyces sp. V4-01]|uniref:Leucine rich repeat variant n=1 Tax=Actinacidiphila polyblastidii TaxID=3110430 RepID=A0ABU7PLX7_9ACTN|nr:hypothetical protein [Streptomyces sp. V4-01]
MQDIRRAALRNPAAPAAAAAFAGSRPVLLHRALAPAATCPRRSTARSPRTAPPGVRADLAANPAIGEELMRATADDPTPEVRRGLAANPRAPLDVLASRAGTAGAGATLPPRIAAASPAEVEASACSPIPAVRMLAAGRRDLPHTVRDRLADDPDAKVVKAVAGLSDTPLRAGVERHGVHVLAAVAADPDAAPALLEDLARHGRPVRKDFRVIAQHGDATATALLVCLEHPGARRWAAGHPALAPPVAAGLVADPDGQAAEAAAANPALPPAAVADLLSGRGGQRPPVRRESR